MRKDFFERIQAEIVRIEKEIRETPYHKGTEHHLGRLKAKLAKLKRAEERVVGSAGGGFAVKKSGDATIIFLGPPSVGKSTLLNQLTNAKATVAPWPFTTVRVIPGMLAYKGAKIQIFDLPGIIGGAAKGLGRGREVLSVAASADLILLIVDVETENQVPRLLKEMREGGVEKPVLTVVNKVDLLGVSPKPGANKIYVSAEKQIGLEKLKERIWELLGLVRIYLKPWGGEVQSQPLIMKKDVTVAVVAKKIFNFPVEFKEVLLWGPSAKFPKQAVGLKQCLTDGDILSFVLKKAPILTPGR